MAVNVHDFEDKTLGKVVPYGVYDLSTNAAGSASASTRTRPSSRSTPSGPGLSASGASAIRRRPTADDHGRLRRLQRSARAAVESRVAEARRRDQPNDLGPPLSTRHLEVEQDRASPVLPHHAELARPAADQPACRRRSDRRDHDDKRPDGRQHTRPAPLRERQQGERTEMASLDIPGDPFHPEWNYTIAPRAPQHPT